MDRRNFLSLMTAGGAATAAVAGASAETITEVNDKVPSSYYERLSLHQLLMKQEAMVPATVNMPSGSWKVFWTGWKENVQLLERVGQWVGMWADNGTKHLHYVVYVSVPGHWGPIMQGECVALESRFTQQTWLHPLDLDGQEMGKLHALEAFLELIRIHDWKIPVLIGKQPWNMSRTMATDAAWETLSDRVKFYLDPQRAGFTGDDLKEWNRAVAMAIGYGYMKESFPR